jgi:ribosome biogenesis protein ERB1
VPLNGAQDLTFVSLSPERKDQSFATIITDKCIREEQLHFFIPPNISPAMLTMTQSTLAPATLPPATQSSIKWISASGAAEDGPILTIELPGASGLSRQLTWHRKGDYLASVCKQKISQVLLNANKPSFIASSETQGSVWMHQISRRHSQAPFKKIKGAVQMVLFHPTKPHFFVAVRVPLAELLLVLIPM